MAKWRALVTGSWRKIKDELASWMIWLGADKL